MLNLGDVVANFKANTLGFEAGVKKAAKSLETATDRMKRSYQAAEASSKVLLGGVTAVGAGLVALTGKAISTAAQFESMGVSLKTAFQGNEEAAKAAQEQIVSFAAKTPFQLQEVMTAFIKLKNMGLDPSQEAMTAYGDTASAMGKGLNDMVEAVADAATGEFERLKEFGIRSSSEGDKVKFTFQGVTTEVGKNSAEIEKYLINLGKTKFAGGMEAQSRTLTGLLSTLGDNFGLTLARIANDSGLFNVAKGAADRLIAGLEELRAKIDEVGGVVNLLEQFFEEHKSIIYQVAGAIMVALVPALIVLAGSVWAVVGPLIPFLAAGAAIGFLLDKLTEHFGGWQATIDRAREAWTWMIGVMNGDVSSVDLADGRFKTLIQTFETVWGVLQRIWDMLQKLQPVWDFLGGQLKDLWSVFKDQLIPELKEFWDILAPDIIPALKLIGAIIGGVVVVAFSVMVNWVTKMTEALSNLLNFLNKVAAPLAEFGRKAREIGGGILGGIGKAIGIPGFASGVTNFQGGLAYVHQGELLANLPRGTNVFNAKDTQSMLTSSGQQQPIQINLHGNFLGDKQALRSLAELIGMEQSRLSAARGM